jgi:hypothetical protein
MPLVPLKKQSCPPAWFTSHKKELHVQDPEDGQPGSAQQAPLSRSELAEQAVAFDCDAATERHRQKSGSLLAPLHSMPPAEPKLEPDPASRLEPPPPVPSPELPPPVPSPELDP